MADFLLQAPRDVLLLAISKIEERPYSELEARISLYLDVDRGILHGLSRYARQWRWPKTTLYKRWPGLTREVWMWCSWNGDAPDNALARRYLQLVPSTSSNAFDPRTDLENRGTVGERRGNGEGTKNGDSGAKSKGKGTTRERSGNGRGTLTNHPEHPNTPSNEGVDTWSDLENPDPGSVENETSEPGPTGPQCKPWHHEFAATALERMRSLRLLSKNVETALRRDEPAVLDNWAHVFRLLDEQDGWTQDQIRIALRFLFHCPNEWAQNRWIQSVSSLRSKTRTGDKTRFEAIYNQATSDERKTTGRNSRAGFDDPQGSYDRIRRAADAALDLG